MKKCMFLAIAAVSFLFSACTEEGFTKVFQCESKYPYFSSITHKCYETEAAMKDGEKRYQEQFENNQNANGDDEDESEN